MAKNPALKHVKEGAVLKGVLDYLGYEGISARRNQSGRCTMGGEVVHLPEGWIAAIRTLPQVRGKNWDGTILIGAKFYTLCPEGTPDVSLDLPAGRAALNPWTKEYETCDRARACHIEVKRPTGGRVSEAQRAFEARVQKDGGLLWVVRSMEDLREAVVPKMELPLFK